MSSIRVDSKADISGILLWDIDGTLVRAEEKTKSSIHVEALGLNQRVEIEDLPGFSDWEVLVFYAKKYNLEAGLLKDAFQKLEHAEFSLSSKQKYSPLLGAEKILSMTSEIGWINGILTGNTVPRAFKKLEGSGLVDLISRDFIFACRLSEERIDIANRAVKATNVFCRPVVIIGDSHRDVLVAKALNLKSVTVLTGLQKKDYLLTFSPDLLIEDLHLGSQALISFLEKNKKLMT